MGCNPTFTLSRLAIAAGAMNQRLLGRRHIGLFAFPDFQSRLLDSAGDCAFAIGCNPLPQPPDYNFTLRSRKALLMTETELRLIAAPAMIGLSSRPKNG